MKPAGNIVPLHILILPYVISITDIGMLLI
jgi:hypothetical protein